MGMMVIIFSLRLPVLSSFEDNAILKDNAILVGLGFHLTECFRKVKPTHSLNAMSNTDPFMFQLLVRLTCAHVFFTCIVFQSSSNKRSLMTGLLVAGFIHSVLNL